MKKLKPLFLLSLFLIIAFAARRFFRFQTQCSIDYKSSILPESARELDNPYIGWYQPYNYYLTDESPYDTSLISEQEYGPGLVMLEFNLQHFSDVPVNDAGLRQLEDILAAWHSRGRQLIVRFVYDWDGNALEQEPKSLSLILDHMSQTAEVINRHSDCIHILQGIFVGSWGEMHSSNYMGENDMLTLIRHLASVTDPGIFLAVRTPEQWRTIVQSAAPLSEDNAFDGSLPARLSLFNDGMMGSETDLGTYADPSFPLPQSDYAKRFRQEELLFQKELCLSVPNGGEVVIDNPYNDFSSAIQNLSLTHVSYLNNAYDETVLSKWKESACMAGNPYAGMSGYDYITRHLGYRYVLRSSEITYTQPDSETASLALTLENVGFSGSYRNFTVSLTLDCTETGHKYVLPIQTDTRFWNPESDISLEASFEIQQLAAGTYEIYLGISDPLSGFPVLLANEGADAEKGCHVGTLTIRKLSQWNLLFSALVGKPQNPAVRFPFQL